MNNSVQKFQICGIIFDSAPGDRRLLSLYRAISSIYGRDRRCSCIVSWIITLGMAAKWVAEVRVTRSLNWIFLEFVFRFGFNSISVFDIHVYLVIEIK